MPVVGGKRHRRSRKSRSRKSRGGKSGGRRHPRKSAGRR